MIWTILKVAFTVFVTACVLLVGTYVYIAAQIPVREKATGLGALLSMTVYSPVWWLLVLAVIAFSWWLARRWLF